MNAISVIGMITSLVLPLIMLPMVFSLLNPFLLLLPVTGEALALVMGIVGLVQIKKSKGAQGGRGFAITAIVLSMLVFLTVCVVIISTAMIVWAFHS
jgi:hypothetical protein